MLLAVAASWPLPAWSQPACAAPALKQRLLQQGAVPERMTSREFAAFVDAESHKWAGVVKASGARVD